MDRFFLKPNNITLADLKQLEAEMRAADPRNRLLGFRFFKPADAHLLSPAGRKTYNGVMRMAGVKYMGYYLVWNLRNIKLAGLLFLAQIVGAVLQLSYGYWWNSDDVENYLPEWMRKKSVGKKVEDRASDNY